MSSLFQTKTLIGIFIMPSRWNNNLQVDVSLHSDTLFRFRANQSLLLLLSGEATNAYSLLVQTHVCCTQGEHANRYTTRIRWTNTYSLLVQTHVCCTQGEHANCYTTRIRWTEDIQLNTNEEVEFLTRNADDIHLTKW